MSETNRLLEMVGVDTPDRVDTWHSLAIAYSYPKSLREIQPYKDRIAAWVYMSRVKMAAFDVRKEESERWEDFIPFSKRRKAEKYDELLDKIGNLCSCINNRDAVGKPVTSMDVRKDLYRIVEQSKAE